MTNLVTTGYVITDRNDIAIHGDTPEIAWVRFRDGMKHSRVFVSYSDDCVLYDPSLYSKVVKSLDFTCHPATAAVLALCGGPSYVKTHLADDVCCTAGERAEWQASFPVAFIDTDAAREFVAAGDDQSTSVEIMRAIASFATDADDAWSIWEGGRNQAVTLRDIWARVTDNGRIPATDFYWGAPDNHWAVEGNNVPMTATA